jgi:uncharacterized protein YjbI with pentapeptide repeats
MLNMSWKIAIALVLATATVAQAENPNHLQQLLSTKECPQCNLASAGLVTNNLAGANLSQANLVGANLSQANLSGANLRWANLTGASLYGADLTGADLTGANLNNTDLREAYLTGAKLQGVNLQTAYVRGTIGLTTAAGTAGDFYKWGYQEWQNNNYVGAITQYNQALQLEPTLAGAYFGRALSRFKLQDDAGAVLDATRASQLYKAKGDQTGILATQNFVKSIELSRQPTKTSEGGGGSFFDVITGLGSTLLGLF